MWVIFDDLGNAAWFGPAAVARSELLDEEELRGLFAAGAPNPLPIELVEAVLKTCRRLPDGSWRLRDPVVMPEPTAEEIAAAREADYSAALAARDAEIDARIISSDVYRLFLRGEMTLTAYRTAAAEIAASVPMPER